MNLIFL